MGKAKTAAAETTPKATAKKPPKLETGYEAPERLYIIGKDPGFLPGEPGFDPELEDPDRIGDPSDDYVQTMIEKGHDQPVCVVRKPAPPGVDGGKAAGAGKCFVLVNGRQHTMGARLGNRIIGDKADPIVVPYYVRVGEATALDVTRANEWAKRDSPLVKARRAARLVALGYKEGEILSSFSDDGARAITKMTLINWKRAANCVPEVAKGFEAGEYPITILYEIGKIGYKGDLTAEEKSAQQCAALDKLRAEGGTLRGADGRANASDAAGGSDEEGEEKGPRTKSTHLGKEALREIAAIFELDEEENTWTDKFRNPDKTLYVPRVYEDGDFQALTAALMAAIVGNDPTGEALSKFPSVYRHIRKYLRSKPVEQTDDKGDEDDTE